MASTSAVATPEKYLPIDLIDEAIMAYTDVLPPFIQTNLDPAIQPGHRHEVIPKTKTGAFPSITKSTKRVYLVCRAWDNDNSNRFWTLDHSDVRYIVKAFPTHAQPDDVPKISYHVWEGMGRNFQKSRVAYDADEKLYRTQHANKAIRKGFGSSDLNKGLRAWAEYLEHAEHEKRSLKRRKITPSDSPEDASVSVDDEVKPPTSPSNSDDEEKFTPKKEPKIEDQDQDSTQSFSPAVALAGIKQQPKNEDEDENPHEKASAKNTLAIGPKVEPKSQD